MNQLVSCTETARYNAKENVLRNNKHNKLWENGVFEVYEIKSPYRYIIVVVNKEAAARYNYTVSGLNTQTVEVKNEAWKKIKSYMKDTGRDVNGKTSN